MLLSHAWPLIIVPPVAIGAEMLVSAIIITCVSVAGLLLLMTKGSTLSKGVIAPALLCMSIVLFLLLTWLILPMG